MTFTLPASNSTVLQIGAVGAGGPTPAAAAVAQYIDDFRVTKGVCRHSTGFLPDDWEAVATAHDAGDDYFSSRRLLLHGDDFTDSSSFTQTVTSSGPTITTTAGEFVYGTGAISFGGGSNRVATQCGASFTTNDFTLELRARGNFGYGSAGCLFSDATNSFFMSGGALRLSGTAQIPTINATSNTDYSWLVVVRKAGVVSIWVNGVRVGTYSGVNWSSALVDLSAFYLGNYSSPVDGWSGQMEEVRVADFAQYDPSTLTITDPLAAYPNYVSNLGDRFPANTNLILNGNGANGSTTITDSSSSPQTVTSDGTAINSTTQLKFGSGSLRFASSSSYVQVAAGAAHNLGANSGDFTVDFWQRLDASMNNGLYYVPLFQYTLDVNNWWGLYYLNGMLRIVSSVAGAIQMLASRAVAPAAVTFSHIEVSRSENVWYASVNGALSIAVQLSVKDTGVPSEAVIQNPLWVVRPTLILRNNNVVSVNLHPGLPIELSFAVFGGGAGSISGTVKVLSALAPNRVVRLYDRASGTLVASTISDSSTAVYLFTNIPSNKTYYAIALDVVPGYNATIEDQIVPV